MDVKNVQISFLGMEPTEAIKDYVIEKLAKYDHFLAKAIEGEVVLKATTHARGTSFDFVAECTIRLPNSLIHVTERGNDIYALIDAATDVLARRLKRYNDKLHQWEGQSPWAVEYVDEVSSDAQDEYDEVGDNFAEYIPKISIRLKLEDLSPMEEAEAIEHMELIGKSQYLFRNKRNNKISMVYRTDNGLYGLVEPAEDNLS